MTGINRSGGPSPLDGLDEMLAIAIRCRAEAALEVDIFDRYIDALKRDIAKRDGTEVMIDEDSKVPPPKQLEYQDMRGIDALERYLKDKDRRGMRIRLSKAVQDLMQGGVEPGRRLAQNLKIALSGNSRRFDWTPQGRSKRQKTIVKKGVPNDQIFVWLAEEGDTTKRRARKKLAMEEKSVSPVSLRGRGR